MSGKFYTDPDTQEVLVGILASTATSLGVGAPVTIPGAVLIKLALRMADAGVEIPSNIDLTALQDKLRNLEELPG